MYTILNKKTLAREIKRIDISAPEIAAKGQPGQFVIIRLNEQGERIPLTIADFDRDQGIITLIFQEVGRSTKDLGRLQEGDNILDVVGPLGKPSEIRNFGNVVCIGGGVGVAPIYPITRALKYAGNEITAIIGARSNQHLILADEMAAVSDVLYITTDDGSAGEKGLVTDVLKNLLKSPTPIDLVMAIGPLIMMEAVAEVTRPFKVKTVVSLNPIMVDGTGMCGACRVAVGKETKFACVDGPEFDGHLVDWAVAKSRARMFKNEEKIAMETCSGGGCQCHGKN
ncbi:MAG: sulfide/dihydroorotate dehydrogenase-like FAD/NAD-binding protein [Syntrophomonadaceae bacterium]|jgi:ferredoxin--NADP+ reductase